MNKIPYTAPRAELLLQVEADMIRTSGLESRDDDMVFGESGIPGIHWKN